MPRDYRNGIRLPYLTSDLSSPPNGSVWSRSDQGQLRAQLAGEVCPVVLGSYISHPSNAWHKAGQAGTVSAGTPAEGTMFLTPFWPGRACTITQLAYEITVQGSSADGTDEMRAGIYATDDATGLPSGAPVVDFGTTDLEATSGVVVWNVTDQALAPKLYWLARVRQTSGVIVTAAQLRQQIGDNANYRVVKDTASTPSIGTGAGGYGVYSQTGVTGALPSIGTLTMGNFASPVLLMQFA